MIPGVKTETTDVFEKTVAVDEKIGTSGKYETYASTENIIPITEDSSKLRYATLYISNIKLSKYSKLEITPYNGAKIDWAIENPVYSEVKQLSYADATSATKLAISANSADSTFTYQVPVFPYTGMAVITEWDKNGKAITYYLAPTENKYKTTSGGLDIFTNTNELSALLGTTSVNNGINPVKAYKATSTEIAAAQGATIKTANDGTSKLGQTAQVYKAYYSKGKIVLKVHLVNNWDAKYNQLEKINITLKTKKGDVIGTYKSPKKNLKISPNSTKDITLEINKPKDKYADLRNAKVNVKMTFGYRERNY